LAILTIIYALSPIDLIPDYIPVVGYIDDLIILPLMVAATIKLIPNDIINQCRIESEQIWKEGKPKKWYYATPIVFIWLIIIALIRDKYLTYLGETIYDYMDKWSFWRR